MPASDDRTTVTVLVEVLSDGSMSMIDGIHFTRTAPSATARSSRSMASLRRGLMEAPKRSDGCGLTALATNSLGTWT
ncbi:MAG: hypothetical protein ACK56I_00465, partial [bacterium]